MLWVIRKTKALFLKLKLHVLVEHLSNSLLTLAYLSKLSKWVAKTPMPSYDDFFSKTHDYNKRYDLYHQVVQQEKLDDICYIEFGVSTGQSFRWWIENNKNTKSKFFGFDTFVGLPEKWGSFGEGAMSAKGNIPDIRDDRCEFKKGLFQETLPSFLQNFKTGRKKVIHLDADLYSSTLYVLTMLWPILEKNDILIFDEFNVPTHEFKAFSDFTDSYRVKYEVIACVNNYYQIAFKILCC